MAENRYVCGACWLLVTYRARGGQKHLDGVSTVWQTLSGCGHRESHSAEEGLLIVLSGNSWWSGRAFPGRRPKLREGSSWMGTLHLLLRDPVLGKSRDFLRPGGLTDSSEHFSPPFLPCVIFLLPFYSPQPTLNRSAGERELPRVRRDFRRHTLTDAGAACGKGGER